MPRDLNGENQNLFNGSVFDRGRPVLSVPGIVVGGLVADEGHPLALVEEGPDGRQVDLERSVALLAATSVQASTKVSDNETGTSINDVKAEGVNDFVATT